MNPKIFLLLGILSIIGIISIVIGNILDDHSYWIVSDVYIGCTFGVIVICMLYNYTKLKK